MAGPGRPLSNGAESLDTDGREGTRALTAPAASGGPGSVGWGAAAAPAGSTGILREPPGRSGPAATAPPPVPPPLPLPGTRESTEPLKGPARPARCRKPQNVLLIAGKEFNYLLN